VANLGVPNSDGSYVPHAWATLTDATLTGNAAQAGTAGFPDLAHGGGVYNQNGDATLEFCTVVGNAVGTAGSSGSEAEGGQVATRSFGLRSVTPQGHPVISVGTAVLFLEGDIIWGSGVLTPLQALTAPHDLLIREDLYSNPSLGPVDNIRQPNILGSCRNDTGWGRLFFADVIAADPRLGPLQDNGGPTRTMAPLAGSPALDAGTTNGAPVSDQHGAARDAKPDLGAFESVSPLAPLGVPAPLFGPYPFASADQAFVKGLYHAAVQRDADPGSLAAYTGLLDAGLATTAQVAAAVYNSTEARQAQVTSFYRAVLHHAPDAGSLAAYVAALQAGADEATLLAGLFGTAEFAPASDNGAFLTNLYSSVLGHAPDAGNFIAYKALLDGGQVTRPQLAQTLLRSSESAQRAGSAFIRTFLQRAPDAGTLAAMAQGVAAGVPYGTYAVIFLGSQEFFNHAQAATAN
jgi:hypothetical protein